MTMRQESFTFDIPAQSFKYLGVPTHETEGFWIFEMNVEQLTSSLYDIGVYVLDHDNFLIWQTRQLAARGTTSYAAPTVSMLASTKLHWGTLSFRPPTQGEYYLVLDNSHSTFTPKKVTVLAYWITNESGARRAVREALSSLGWKQTWKMFEEVENSIFAKKLSAACLIMRAALATLWKQVAEQNCGQPIHFDPGKSIDIGLLQKPMESYVPSYTLSMVRQSWSLASELTHTEKRGGKEPPLDQVVLALRSVYASAAYLVTLTRR